MTFRMTPLKRAARFNQQSLSEKTSPDFEFEYIDIGSVSAGKGVTSTERMIFKDAPSRARRVVRSGDVIVSTVRTYLKAVAHIDAELDGSIVSTGFAVLTPRPGCHHGFLSYALEADTFLDRVIQESTGVSYPAINPENLARLRILLPDLATQKSIAKFLDRETTRIDTLVKKKARFADLIIEREEASFLRAVTGKDESGKFIDSGADWIGELPEGWLAPKFVHVARLESGHTPSRKIPEYWIPEECVVPWVSLADVWQLRSGATVYLEDTQEKVSEIGLANSSARILPKDTVVLSRTASVGFPGILGKPMATTQDFVGWIPSSRIRPKFLYYVLRAMKPEFRRLMIGSTHKTIYMPDIRAFRTPLPPIEMQDEIVQKLDATIDTYRKVHVRLLESIERLTELRASLITAAVTGQIDPDTYRRHGTTDRTLERIEQEMSA